MFINRVKNPDDMDLWYGKRDRIKHPTDKINDSGYWYSEVYGYYYNKRDVSQGKDCLSNALMDYNPKYTPEDGWVIQMFCIVLLSLNEGLNNELNNLLIELEI